MEKQIWKNRKGRSFVVFIYFQKWSVVTATLKVTLKHCNISFSNMHSIFCGPLVKQHSEKIYDGTVIEISPEACQAPMKYFS